jgi:hypothetical protein
METANKTSCLSLFVILRHIPGSDCIAVLLWKRREREREKRENTREVMGHWELEVGKLVFQVKMVKLCHKELSLEARCQWFMPIILATWEAETKV